MWLLLLVVVAVRESVYVFSFPIPNSGRPRVMVDRGDGGGVRQTRNVVKRRYRVTIVSNLRKGGTPVQEEDSHDDNGKNDTWSLEED